MNALQRHSKENLKQIFPEKEIARPQSQFQHSCVCDDLYVLTIGLPMHENMWNDPKNL
jgi:hypothetical protein